MGKRGTVSDGIFTWHEFDRDDLLSTLHVHVHCAYRSKLGPDWQCRRAHDTRGRLYFILGGEAEVRHHEQTFRLVPNRLYLIPASTPHDHSCSDSLDLFWCHFSATLHTEVGLFTNLTPAYELAPGRPSRTRQLFAEMVTNFDDDSPSAVVARSGILLQLLAPFFDTLDREAFETRNNMIRQLSRALSAIEKRLGEHLTVAELADYVHMSPSHFSRRFVETFGVSPSRYVMLRRVENAQVRLIQGNDTIDTIGTELGFADGFHFSKTFKRITGISPSRYRQLCHMP